MYAGGEDDRPGHSVLINLGGSKSKNPLKGS